jgi:prepilin-type processing-associated H-X9-DG protein
VGQACGWTWAANATAWIHSEGMNFLYIDGHVKWKRASTDPDEFPFAAYDTAGRPSSMWVDNTYRCGWLFRPNLQ